MKIPGLGCLKGCLFVIVVLIVGCLAGLGADPAQGLDRAWEELLGRGPGWAGDVQQWIEELGGPSS